MKTMKLSAWCNKVGVKYLTAWRWFKNNEMPVYAYQTDSGTILVEDDETKINDPQNETISLFFKKTMEFAKNGSSIEDFAAYIFSNFSIMPLNKYTKQKPSDEDIKKYFHQFFPKKNKPILNASELEQKNLNNKNSLSSDLNDLFDNNKINNCSLSNYSLSFLNDKGEGVALTNMLPATTYGNIEYRDNSPFYRANDAYVVKGENSVSTDDAYGLLLSEDDFYICDNNIRKSLTYSTNNKSKRGRPKNK